MGATVPVPVAQLGCPHVASAPGSAGACGPAQAADWCADWVKHQIQLGIWSIRQFCAQRSVMFEKNKKLFFLLGDPVVLPKPRNLLVRIPAEAAACHEAHHSAVFLAGQLHLCKTEKARPHKNGFISTEYRRK